MTVLPWLRGSKSARAATQECADKVTALERSQAVIEFSPDGTIIHANDLFVQMLGYSLEEIHGRNMKMLAESSYHQSPEYRKFFERLMQGQSWSGGFSFKAKTDAEVATEASFSPLVDENGSIYKIVAMAINTTEEVQNNLEYREKIDALKRSSIVAEFNMDGTIISANQNLLDLFGYGLDQVRGKHHSILLDAQDAQSQAFRQLWEKLNRGEFVSGEFKRRNYKGEDIWLEVTYSPVLDRSGKPFKVVELATDITKNYLDSIDAKGQIAAINRCQAIIHFALDGTVLWANQNFLQTMGYSLNEIVGRHHKMFVEAKERESKEYKVFWENLNAGKDNQGIFCRQASNGKQIWLQAAYTAISNSEGKLTKVVKFAQDITEGVERREASGRAVDSTFGQIIGAVSTVSQQSQSVSNASESTLETVQAVAAASEELSASINAIGQSMDESKAAVEIVNRERYSLRSRRNALTKKPAQ